MRAKIVLSYNPMDQDELRIINDMRNGERWRRVVEDIAEELRRVIKYDSAASEEKQNAYDEIREFMFKLLEESNLRLHE